MSAGPVSPLERFRAAYIPRFGPLLKECERRLAAVAAGAGGLLAESSSVTLSAGGKRLRPLLVFLSARSGSQPAEAHYVAAVAVELVHMATLVHDDVLDAAELRRGVPTLVSRYGPDISTAAGDYLFASAFRLLTESGSSRAVTMLAATSLDLSRGEFVQMSQAYDYGLELKSYEERCRLKTAGLFSVSCMLGGLFSGCRDETLYALDEFGRCLGLAFQITDDILDFAGDAAATGKKVGTDLLDGTVTLPLMIALKKDPQIMELLPLKPPVAGSGADSGGQAEPSLSREGIYEVCERVMRTGALDESAAAACGYAARARQAIEAVSDELETGPLGLIAEMAADRKV